MIRATLIATSLVFSTPVFAADVASFVVAADSSYGVDTCLGTGDSCGAAVASGWCVANGYLRAVGFRHSDPSELTGSVAKVSTVAARADDAAIVITCER